MSETRLPAWKRLGLKLKHAKEESLPTQFNGHAERNEPPAKKRRVGHVATSGDNLSKKSGPADAPRAEASTTAGLNKPKKQVSFTNDTKTTDGDTAISIIPSEVVDEAFPQADSSKKSKKRQQPTQPSATKTKTTLDYLSQFYGAHSAWKFNKNREVWILKHAFSTQDIPVAYNLMLAQYIYGLKSSNTRSRLRQECIKANPEQDSANQITDEAADTLKAFPGVQQAEDSKVSEMLQNVARPHIILWAVNAADSITHVEQATKDIPTQEPAVTQKVTVQKKRKNRTAVVEYSSSSSSESDSSTDTESETSTSESDNDSDQGA